jgi:DNA-directed RNA polymerase sigma subunit (sigma70/sigma32)
MNVKTERNKQIIEHHRLFPHYSLREIGELFGISKQRVSKILKGESSGNLNTNK